MLFLLLALRFENVAYVRQELDKKKMWTFGNNALFSSLSKPTVSSLRV